MAQTKTKSPSKRRSSSTRKSSSRKRTSNAKSASTPKQANSSKSSPTSSMSKAADKATNAVGTAAEKAKMPLVAGGAALAGAAGGMALGRRRRRGHRLERAVKLAGEFQRARSSANGSKHRSPVEILLEGLTSRRSRA